jgi:hypothetical protein
MLNLRILLLNLQHSPNPQLELVLFLLEPKCIEHYLPIYLVHALPEEQDGSLHATSRELADLEEFAGLGAREGR